MKVFKLWMPWRKARFYVRRECGPFAFMIPKSEKRIGYMDSVEFDHELSHASKGNRIFPRLADVEREKPCTQEECGVYEVEVRFRRVVKAERFPRRPNI